MWRLALGAVAAIAGATGAPAEDRGLETLPGGAWMMQGASVAAECVAECSDPATLWLLDETGDYAFGHQCGARFQIELAGWAGFGAYNDDAYSFGYEEAIEITVDGEPVGPLMAYSDNPDHFYIGPVPDPDDEAAKAAFLEALATGAKMVMTGEDGRAIVFDITGGGTALERFAAFCAAEEARQFAGFDAPTDVWSVATYPDDAGTPYARIRADWYPVTFSVTVSAACGGSYWLQGAVTPDPGAVVRLAIDGTAFGAWEVGEAETAEYHFPLRPQDPDIRDSDRFLDALKSGSELHLIHGPSDDFIFTLAGAADAIGAAEDACP